MIRTSDSSSSKGHSRSKGGTLEEAGGSWEWKPRRSRRGTGTETWDVGSNYVGNEKRPNRPAFISVLSEASAEASIPKTLR